MTNEEAFRLVKKIRALQSEAAGVKVFSEALQRETNKVVDWIMAPGISALEQRSRALIAEGRTGEAFLAVLGAQPATPVHTDILLGDDGRGSMFWKIACNGRVQEVNAPLPKGYRCRFCDALISPTTTVIGMDPAALVEDTAGVVIEPLTKDSIRRAARGGR